MSLEFVRKLPTPTEIREQYPLSARATEIKKQRDAEIAKVFTGDSDKFLVIVGPVSYTHLDVYKRQEPISLPFSSGITRPIAFAAPVLFGTMLTAAARDLLRSPFLCGPSRVI